MTDESAMVLCSSCNGKNEKGSIGLIIQQHKVSGYRKQQEEFLAGISGDSYCITMDP